MAYDRSGALLPLLVPAAILCILTGVAAIVVSCSLLFGPATPLATAKTANSATPVPGFSLFNPSSAQGSPWADSDPDANEPPSRWLTSPTRQPEPTPTPFNVIVSRSQQVYVYNPTPRTAVPSDALRSAALTSFPRPTKDNGRGLHWFPTRQQTKQVVDTFLPELDAMRIRWVVILQGLEPYDFTANEYLVDRLIERGIMPVMRIDRQVGELDLPALGRVTAFYRAKGVRYFQIFNEPNAGQEEWGSLGAFTAEEMVKYWTPAARTVLANGGYPGFPAMMPIAGDAAYLAAGLAQLKQDKALDLVNSLWLSVHNYGGLDAEGFYRYRQYDAVVRQVLGIPVPLIGTEGGVGTAEAMAKVIVPMYQYMSAQREPYFFAFSPWLLGNAVGGGHDPRWEAAAWYDGTLSKLHPKGVVDLAKSLASGG